MKPVIYVVVNKSLDMTPGKIAAQVGHAVAQCMAEFGKPYWTAHHQRWLIVLEAENKEQIDNLHQYLYDRGVTRVERVIDEGVNEITPFSTTALGIGPYDKDGPEAALLSSLKKYRHPKPARPTLWDWWVGWINRYDG